MKINIIWAIGIGIIGFMMGTTYDGMRRHDEIAALQKELQINELFINHGNPMYLEAIELPTLGFRPGLLFRDEKSCLEYIRRAVENDDIAVLSCTKMIVI